jgi:alanine racemase
MDQFMVDVTAVPDAAEGDRVTLIGYDGDEHISAETLGDISGRFNYELVCDFNKRLPRAYIYHGKLEHVTDYCYG